MSIEIGQIGRAETIVTVLNTAKALGSGLVEVFATPAMVALMEEAAVHALNLGPEESSVGTALEIRHLAATPLGLKVWAVAEVIEIDRRRLVFKVEAYDEKEKIGEGRHERFIIDSAKFLEKVNAKREEQGA
ncbi:thioesterase family protein [Paradesulfitobacterium ferrireducens]|uniref:thioesterase family protein n=1 Tax=Paradesulfitobacterium ferrireducens TaxID=2816476 RepID=UPI001A8EAC38|nr:thioesterase family protein [Paradesulfitobacterium ferrireducens]